MSDFGNESDSSFTGDLSFDREAPYSEWMKEHAQEVRSRRNRATKRAAPYFAALAVGVGALLAGLAAARNGINDSQETVTVCHKEAIDSDLMVTYAEEDGSRHVAEVKKTYFIGGLRQNATEVYAGLEEGTSYTFSFSGFRIEAIDLYPNITNVKPVPLEQQVNFCE